MVAGQEIRFGDLLAEPLRNGLTRPKAVRGSGVKMVNMGELFAHRRIGDIEMDRVPLSPREEVAFLLAPGDLLFARQSLVFDGAGKCSVFLGGEEPVTFESHLIRARVNPDLAESLFYFYYFNSGPGRSRIESIVEQVAAAGIRGSDLRKLAVPVRPIEEQRTVVALLSAFDDKIELNRRVETTAQELAHAIFRSRYRSDDPDLPHARLGEHLEVVRGLSYTGSGLADAGMPLHNLNSVYEGGGYKRDGIKHYTGEYKPRHGTRPGDVVVATVEQGFDELLIAFPARIPRCFGVEGIFSQDLFRLDPKPDSPLTRTFVYLMLLRGHLHEEIAGFANGTTINRIPVEALQKPRFAVPPRELVAEIDALVTPLFNRAEAAEDESETLAQLRDTLLPKLISGEVRLRDAEA